MLYYVYDEEAETDLRDIYGKKIVPQVSKTYYDMKGFLDAGIPTCEAKVNQETKFLQRRYGKSNIIPDISKFNVCIIDIETQSEKFPDVKAANDPINLISMWMSKTNTTYTLGLKEYTGDSDTVKNYWWCADEKRMLEVFMAEFRRRKVDIVSGWNCKGFDIPYIIHRAKNLGIETTMSPLNKYEEKNDKDGYHTDGGGYTLAGLSTLDYIDLYKNFTYDKKENYRLNTICIEELGEGKVEYEGELNDLWKNDWNKYVEYNIQDVMLVKKLNDKRRLFELATYMSYLCLVPLEKVFSSVNLISGLIMKYCHEKNIYIPDVKASSREKLEGGYVMAKEGFWKWCMNFDVQSLYPTIIRQFNISPETLVIANDCDDTLIKTPFANIYYKKEQGILPEIVDNIFKDRLDFIDMFNVKQSMEDRLPDSEITKRYKLSSEKIKTIKEQLEKDGQGSGYYRQQEQVRKIFMNSMYGVLGNPYFCLYNIHTARTITACGQDIIKYLTNKTDKYLRKNWEVLAPRIFPEYNLSTLQVEPLQESTVVLIDTDSGHFCFDEMARSIGKTFKDDEDFRDFCYKVDERFFKPYFKMILEKYSEIYNTPNLINFQREKIIKKKLILAMKKYADEIVEKKGKIFSPAKLTITGIETVRTDTPQYCRGKILDVLKLIFDTEDKNKVTEFVSEIKKDFYKQPMESIAKPKGVKDYDKYAEDINFYMEKGLRFKKSTPMHNRAAINYNYLVTKYNLPQRLISNKDKIRYCYVYDNNDIRQNIIGFLGKYPESFKETFTIDYDSQWVVVFEDIINRFYAVMGWGKYHPINKFSFSDLS